jgi:hypothetical protein
MVPAPWAGIASRLRAHPTGLALLIAEQTFQEQPGVRRNTLLPEQRTYPLLDLSKRRRPQRKRLLNRRCPRPRSPNHGCPWIQKPSDNATVMLGHRGLEATKFMCPNASENGQISRSTVRAARGDGSCPRHQLVLPKRGKSAKLCDSSGVIWRIPAKGKALPRAMGRSSFS